MNKSFKIGDLVAIDSYHIRANPDNPHIGIVYLEADLWPDSQEKGYFIEWCEEDTPSWGGPYSEESIVHMKNKLLSWLTR